MALDPQLCNRAVTAQDFLAIGQHAEKMVALAREAKRGSGDEPASSAIRLFSQRDIAEVVGMSPQSVSKYMASEPELFRVPDEHNAKGRNKRYSVDQFIAAVRALGSKASTRLDTPLSKGRARTVVFANFKGGCAKSTSAATFATGRALRGERVLLVDVDPQGTLSALLGVQPSLEITVHDTLLPYFAAKVKEVRYAIRKTRIGSVDIIPATSGLSRADVEIPEAARNGEYISKYFFQSLDAALDAVRFEYDYIVIDSPPSLSYLTTIACHCADVLIIPLQPSMPDYASSAAFYKEMGDFFAELDEVLEDPKQYPVVRMLLTRHDGSRPHRDMEAEIRVTYGGLVLGPVFVESNAIKDASNQHLTLYEIDRSFVHKDTLERAVESCNAFGDVIADLAARSAKMMPASSANTTAAAA